MKNKPRKNINVRISEMNNNIKYNIIYSAEYESNKKEFSKIYIYQVFSNDTIKHLSINIKDMINKVDLNSKIESKYPEVFFYLENLKFFPREYNNFTLDISHDIVIKDYLSCFFFFF